MDYLPDWIVLGPTYVGSVLRAGLFLNIHFVLSVAEFGMNHFCSQFKYGQEEEGMMRDMAVLW